ncbi:alanine racemase [Pseudodesulfovibrio senegalensis]|uniref:Alanine racemase n=1 Tax=Pseudodesulfovibrio senegalensis TaxID=1721087 RepID=A0A6N6N4S1_9BACT|nr:alanine racemase [Pseudodesulfovibrio senegalensis]KAB1442778.1 alanine racemase [Pseudodesulfovibrio senegalensis]
MIEYSKIEIQVDLAAVQHNYRELAKAGTRLIAVVKSDAYGHGLAQVFSALEATGADTFAVGYVHEAHQLRESGCRGRIISLLGPVDSDDMTRLAHGDIIPFIGHFDTLRALADRWPAPEDAGCPGTLDIALKFDTGMSRLGFQRDELPELLDFLRAHPQLRPVMASSHLAASDEPDRDALTAGQQALFFEIVDALRGAGFEVEANLSNSAAIMGHEACRYDTQRAGIALYGGNPFAGTARESLGRNLRPTMAATAPVLHVHTLEKGQGISYGHTYVSDRDRTVAVVGAGYADCYSRGLSNRGFMNAGGVRVPILGRVCMQMTCVDVSALAGQGVDLHVGDRVHLLGGDDPGRVDIHELASWWGTITYEALCVLGMNRRVFLK